MEKLSRQVLPAQLRERYVVLAVIFAVASVMTSIMWATIRFSREVEERAATYSCARGLTQQWDPVVGNFVCRLAEEEAMLRGSTTTTNVASYLSAVGAENNFSLVAEHGDVLLGDGHSTVTVSGDLVVRGKIIRGR